MCGQLNIFQYIDTYYMFRKLFVAFGQDVLHEYKIGV